MKRSHRRLAVLLTSASVGLSSILSALPSVYPTGTTIFKPDKTWSGYTVFITPDSDGVVLMDQAPGTKNQGPMPSRS